MSIIDKMKNDDFTSGEKLVIDYILSHFDEFEDLTINHLARLSYTSNATIIRLCHKLNFNGFKQFKIALLKEIEAKRYSINDVDYTVPFHEQETLENIEQNMYSLHLETIHHLHASIDLKTINDISQMLINSKRIFIFAIGDAKITSMNFINKMIKIGYFPILATQHNEQYYITKQINKEDCALFVSYGGNHDDFKTYIRQLYVRNVSIAFITANQNISIKQMINHILYIPDYEKENKIATFYSQISFNYILNLIYAVVYNTKPL